MVPNRYNLLGYQTNLIKLIKEEAYSDDDEENIVYVYNIQLYSY